ncbi:MAG: hypothetical protein LBE08_00960 [Bifidobacteriaceae bacterium]|jgi:hypothetical protein|nr:hypothetical protein [Bifidobacteriaceae bacterium]
MSETREALAQAMSARNAYRGPHTSKRARTLDARIEAARAALTDADRAEIAAETAAKKARTAKTRARYANSPASRQHAEAKAAIEAYLVANPELAEITVAYREEILAMVRASDYQMTEIQAAQVIQARSAK